MGNGNIEIFKKRIVQVRVMISIIVPVYNAERYLEKCITSIVEQNTMMDFELLLINDGSKDKSGVICDKYRRIDKRIRVFHQENAGVAAARNKGISEAVGEYIMFVDSDDWLAQESLNRINDCLKKYDPDVLIYNIKFWSKGEYKTLVDLPVKSSCKKKEVKEHIADVYKKGALASCVNKVYRSSAINSIFYNSGVQYGEDFVFNTKVFLNICSLVTIPDGLYYYNHHADSLSTNVDESKIKELMELYPCAKKFFEQLGLEVILQKELLKNHFFVYLYPYMINDISISKKMKFRNKVQSIKSIVVGDYHQYLKENMSGGVFNCLVRKKMFVFVIVYCNCLSLLKRGYINGKK